MIIAVDEKIPYWEQCFPHVGEVRPFSARKVRRETLRDADALAVRSVTRVDADLLEGSSIRFVGTATIGMDHLDENYLAHRGIRCANAAGSNANAVAEHVAAAMLWISEARGWQPAQKTLAVIGVGQVGSRVVKKAEALGMRVLLCDPPLRDSTGDARYRFLDDVLGADVLTLHVPLTDAGPYPTRHMFDHALLSRLEARQFIINTARGAVIDNPALKRVLSRRTIEGAVLDVWEDEPGIDYELLRLVDLGSPHIAGYSLDGKIRGTEMILEEMCRFFAHPYRWNATGLYPQTVHIRPEAGSRSLAAVRSVVLQAFDIRRVDGNLRALESLPAEAAAEAFDRLRTDYPLRPEFRHFAVELDGGNADIAGTLSGLGFALA